MYKFPERLKELMIETNLSQNELSKLTKIGQSTIARWLSGERKPSVDCIIILAEFFKTTAGYLIGTED